MYKKLKLELFGDTPEETRDTLMCHDTVVENPCFRDKKEKEV